MQQNNNNNNTPLWFISGLLLGGTQIAQSMFLLFGLVCAVFVFMLGSFLSALTFAVVTHWKSLLLTLVIGLIFTFLGHIYMLEEKKKNEDKG